MSDAARPAVAADPPGERATDAVRRFGYLLNAMENAANEDNPAQHGYAGKRQAVLAFVRALAALPAAAPRER